jgi:hypothetical protein
MNRLYAQLFMIALPLAFALPSNGGWKTDFDLDQNGTDESYTDSDVSAGLCLPCKITHHVYNGTNANISFNWMGPGHRGVARSKVPMGWSMETYQSVVLKDGQIAWGAFLPATANYHGPVPSAILYFFGKLRGAKLSAAPRDIEFSSEVAQVGPAEFRYTYTVANGSSDAASFSWPGADYSGTVGSNSAVTKTVTSPYAAIEDLG